MTPFHLHLPDDASPREIARLRNLARVLGTRAIGLIGPDRIDGDSLDGFAGQFGLGTAKLTDDPTVAVEDGQPSPPVVISMSERRPAPAGIEDVARGAIWWFCEGDPRRDLPGDGLGAAISERRARVAMTLRALADRPQDDRILAFADVPRRPWDSIAALQARLDSFLPQMISEAADRDLQDLAIRPPTVSATGRTATAQSVNLVERLTDLKFYIHLLFRGLQPFLRFRGTYVILLHNPTPDILDDILTILGKYGRLVPYTEVVQAVLSNRSPGPGFSLTFDDGYKENSVLLEVLDKHDCAAMFFLNSAPIDSEKPLWFMNRDKDFRRLKPQLKRLDYQSFLATIDETGLTEPCSLRGRFGLTSKEVQGLLSGGHAVGLHTHNHPFLTRLQTSEIEKEIAECSARLRKITGDPSPSMDFAYPDGDHDSRVADDLEALGIRSAVTSKPGPIPNRVRPTMIPRSSLDDTDYPGVALFKLSGAYRCLKRLHAALGHGD